MMRRMTFISLLFLFLHSITLSAQPRQGLPFPVSEHTLKNGLKVILSEDLSLPLVSVVVAYHVGSINEKPGQSGLAYLLENLMFQGSENVGRMQHISLIRRVGGVMNAATSVDRTLFYQTVPSNQLALVLWLESDRMKSLELSASNVERVKKALIDEIRQRKTADPYLESSIIFDQQLFPDFAHSHPVFGSEQDLREITLDDVREFHSTYYRPNNAVLSISGNIDKKKTLDLVHKFFASIPAGEELNLYHPIPFPERKAVVKTYEGSFASLPAFYLGYPLAPPYSDDYFSLKIIEYILLRGKTSRLYKRLIKRDRTAFDMNGGIEERRDWAGFKIFVVSTNETLLERSKKAVFSEISRLKTGIIPEEEMKKSKSLFRLDYIKQYATSMDRAIFLAENYFIHNKIDNSLEALEKYLSVTPSEIAGVMNKYFTHQSVLLHVKIK
ncbi:MAG: M16 family metallopeptidase [Candidatus Aminicenantales bacterium]